jgi:hypothetical protein
MSNYYSSYNQYLGTQRCCNIKSQGSIGPVGPAGPASIGPIGKTGSTGAIGYTGTTGIQGPTGDNSGYTGYTGATGPTGLRGNAGVVIQYIYKNTDFTDSVKYQPSVVYPFNGLPTLACYNGGINGYICSINPQSSESKVKVQFKVQYQASDTVFTKLTLGVVCTKDNGITYSLVGQDIFCGTVNASGPLTNTYTFNYMHSPSTTNSTTYQMFYQLQGNSSNALGLINSSANCIILEEYLGSGSANQGSTGATGSTGPTGPTGSIGPTGSSQWVSTGSNAIQYNGNVFIDGTLDVSGGNIVTSTPYGVTYNYYKSSITSSEIDNSYAYQIILCESGPIILPKTGFTTGDWITIVNLSSITLNVYQNTRLDNLIYSINSTSTGAANSAKFIFYSSGYSYNSYTYYWIIA